MLKAEQNKLVHEANKQLLSIRREELEYFVGVFSDFGTQSALIAGFTLSNVTQVDAISSDVSSGWKWLFWISCSIVLVTSLHVVLTTTFINIFGPGLALRGPAGSMVRAVEGMIKEKDAIFVAFFVSIIVFQISTVSASFLVMSSSAAWTSMVLCLGGLYIWYVYCLRIYNRFKLDEVDFSWNEDHDEGPLPNKSRMFSSDSVEPITSDTIKITSNSTPVLISSPPSSVHGDEYEYDSPKKMKSKGQKNTNPIHSKSDQNSIGSYMEGYLTQKSSSSSHLFGDPWVRRYYVLHKNDLYYYKSKEDYDLDPKKTIKSRPVNISQYILSYAQGSKGELEMFLTPIDDQDDRKIWEFRVDTLVEYDAWINAFYKGGAQRQLAESTVVG